MLHEGLAPLLSPDVCHSLDPLEQLIFIIRLFRNRVTRHHAYRRLLFLGNTSKTDAGDSTTF